MDPVAAAFVASGVAWLSIVAAALLPSLRLDLRILRAAGGLSIAFVGLAALGLTVPSWVALGVLAVGLAAAAAVTRVRRPEQPAPAA